MEDYEKALLEALKNFTKEISGTPVECEKAKDKKEDDDKIGDKFQGSKYFDIDNGKIKLAPIDWTIVERRADGTLIAIAEKVIDCVQFDNETNLYDDSFIKTYTETNFGLNAFIPSEEQLAKWFPNAEDRRAETTDYALEKGVDCDNDGYAFYWTSSPESFCYHTVRGVSSSGQFHNYSTVSSRVGVRPAIEIIW